METQTSRGGEADGTWRRVGRRVRGRIGVLLRFSIAFRILAFVALAPLSAATLRLFLQRWGRYSVGNFEILEFLLSVPGMLALLAVGSIELAALFLEQAGLIHLLEHRQSSVRQAIFRLVPALPRVLGLAARQLVTYLLRVSPFLAGILVAVSALWSGRDLNGLIILKPPVFWLGVAICGVLGSTAAVLAARLFLGWIPALPILLLESGTTAREALGASVARCRGRLLRTARPVAAWAVVAVVVSSVAAFGLRLASDAVLDRVGMSLGTVVPATAAVLVVHGTVAVVLSAVASAAFAGLALEIHGETGGSRSGPGAAAGTVAALPAGGGRRLSAAAAAIVVVSGAATWIALRGLESAERLEITAHRAGAAAAPENTLAALRLAIRDGAEWAEVDVQRSADGALVILHDADFARLRGPRKRVSEATLAEIREIDLGAALDPRFPGERVPTLEDLLSEAAGKIRLNIELKPAGRDDVRPLVLAVVEAVRKAGLAEGTRICSQSYDGVRLAKEIEPRLRIGFIAGAALGDLSRLDVDFLMVNAGLATRGLVRRAGARGIEVHAWTVNDPDLLLPLVDRGVANVITDDVAALRARLEEIRGLEPAERILLRTRNWLAD